MTVHRPEAASLLRLAAARRAPGQALSDPAERFAMAALERESLFGAGLAGLAGASVLLWSQRQLPAARALLELDGLVRRVLLCPPDVAPAHLPAIIAAADVDTIASAGPAPPWPGGLTHLPLSPLPPTPAAAVDVPRPRATEWVLFTSGTSGRPKLVVHTLRSLIGPLGEGPVAADTWGTFYDIRRYGGLQVFLRAMLGGASLVLSDAAEAPGAFLRRAGAEGVSHMLGTPTHWRRALMSPECRALHPRYVRLSGEIADQAILDQLARAFPAARLTHAYASTEAGVGFEVTDGRAGFPASVLGRHDDGREIHVVDGTIRVRSPRAATGYLGGATLQDADGFIDTGDGVAADGARFVFLGRRGGMINVGGQKLYPEEVEAVILRHEGVRAVQVRGRPNPITGTIVVADVALRPGAPAFAALKPALLAHCRAALPPHKVPAVLREVDELAMAASGKLERAGA